jgi:hypothetical protein
VALIYLLQWWLLAFAVTQIIEMPIYCALAPVTWRRAFLLSLATHPVVWFVIPPLAEAAGVRHAQVVWIAEAFAYATEVAMLCAWRVRWWRSIAVAAIANTASFGVGELIRAVWGVP